MDEKEELSKKEKAAVDLGEAVQEEFISVIDVINENKECKDARAYVKLGLAVKSLEELKELFDGDGDTLKQAAADKYGEQEFEDLMKTMIKGMMNYAIENLM